VFAFSYTFMHVPDDGFIKKAETCGTPDNKQ